MIVRTLGVTTVLLGAALASAQGRPVEELPRDVVSAVAVLAEAPKVTISRGDLRVTLALPDAQRGFYRSTRFDWSGMVTQVARERTLFYGPWVDGIAPNIHDFVDTPQGVIAGPRNAATGPAEEFASRDGETVPGYDAAPPGGTFLKIGVGRLRKPDARPYDHFAPYEIADGGAWSVTRGADRITFRQRLPADGSGYGYEYEKTISLGAGGAMTIAHRLRNIGTKPIRTQVYNHNFARFDGAEVGPGVRVLFPFAPTGPLTDPRLATLDGNEVRYERALAPGDREQLPAQSAGHATVPGTFRVIGANGASIAMRPDAPLVRTVLWSMRRTVAVEPFTQIDIAPGSEQSWSWHYVYTGARR